MPNLKKILDRLQSPPIDMPVSDMVIAWLVAALIVTVVVLVNG